jgi:hypothetical protein
MSKKSKKVKDPNVKTFSLTDMMMADLMFFLRPMKERQQEMLFWSKSLERVQNDIVRSQGIDPEKFQVDWNEAYKTGKMVCTKIPDPVVIEKNGNKNNKK